MIPCKIRGCRNLQNVCKDCGRIVCTMTFQPPSDWICVKDQVPPAMKDVLLLAGNLVVKGWNESVQPEEDPSYCSYQDFDSDEITHWMPYPQP